MKHELPTTDSVSFLKELFEERARQNRRLSLRGFAKLLGISPGGLSQILARKKRLSVDRAHDVVRRLRLGSEQADFFLTLVEAEGTTNAARRADLYEKIQTSTGNKNAQTLTVDQFRLISSWFGLPVLEMATAVRPTPSNREIAKRLGLHVTEVEVTLERLERLEMIERVSDGEAKETGRRFVRVKDNFLFKTAIPVEALQSYYREVNERADKAVIEQAADVRVSGTQVFAFDPKQVEEARKLTDDYLNALNRLANTGKSRTEVYQSVAHFFRLTETTENQIETKSTWRKK